MTKPRNPRENTRGRPFEPGNAGKPKGARSRMTLAMEALLEGEAEALSRKAVELALAGDTTALRLCLERLVPPRRDRTVVFELPAMTGAQDHPVAIAALVAAVAAGDLTPTEAQALAAVLAEHRKAIETADLDARISALEAKR
jgi:hypothetical protein